jgi:glycosidase
MPWDASDNAGFTAGQPWLPLNPDHPTCNVAVLSADAGSILTLYRRLIALRRKRAALHAGDIVAVRAEGDILVFERRHDREAPLLVSLNFGDRPRRMTLPFGACVVLSTGLDRDGEVIESGFELRPAEGVIVERGQALGENSSPASADLGVRG